ncbi:MAG: helix-turn-helix transcriptional regulator [Ruminococcaceae bacterium]|nr:helix-turn-helix transcriptional regulator [Oscillospiraceae bacterium]
MPTTLSSERIGANLKRLIKESKYRTQEAFAYACYHDPRVIRRWIQHGITHIDTINHVAEVLNVDVKELLF